MARADRVFRVGQRWHWVYPISLRHGSQWATVCASHPITSKADPGLAPPEVAPGDRCNSPGCRERWPS